MAKKQLKTKSDPVVLPDRIQVEIQEEDIAKGGRKFYDNPVIHALKRAKLPVMTLGPDLAYIGGQEYLADIESAETLGQYLFNQQPLAPYVHILQQSTPVAIGQRMKVRLANRLEKIVGIRETREEK